MLVVPLLGSQAGARRALARRGSRAGPAFAEEDLEMAAGFANQAALAIELAEARAEQQRAAMLDERDRIAADLHDHVIQRLFAAGLSLQSVGRQPRGGPRRPTGSWPRSTTWTTRSARSGPRIFQLQQIPQAPGARAAGAAARRGHRRRRRRSASSPRSGSPAVIDAARPTTSARTSLAVVREALTNVARHARARSAEVDVAATADRLTVDVRDDGVGLGSTERRSGLANLRRRADRRGGTFAVGPREPAGTWLSWSVPLT